jgi:dTDP-4-dehydrorhamnose 3,5-epimerase-like enzyme
MSINECNILNLPQISDPRGNLTFVEANNHIPFCINRVYYLYDVPPGAERGGHAHKQLHQLIIAVSGSFDIHLDDGFAKKTVRLNRGDQGLYVCPMIWREIDNFSVSAVCMVLASEFYDENDYYRQYDAFKKTVFSNV